MTAKLNSFHGKLLLLPAAISLFLLISSSPQLLATVSVQVGFNGVAASGSFGSQAIGSQSAAQTLSFSVSANTTVGSIAVLTLGAANLDFTNAASSSCSAQSYAQATQCTVAVNFAPSAVGLRMGAVVFFSGANNTGAVLASVPIYGIGSGPQIGFGPGAATAIDPKVNGCFLLEPIAIAFDGAGNLFVAEMYGVVKLPAGGGAATAIYPTVDGEGLDYPSGLAVDGAGNLFIADFEHNRVVEVPAGGGAAIAIDPIVKGKALDGPFGLAVDAAGTLYIADALNWRVVEVPSGGGAAIAIDPIVNNAGLVMPQGVAVDGAGNLFIADTGGKRVVEVPAVGAAIAINPTVNGKALWYPYGVALNASGDLLIADTDRSRVVEMPAGGGAPFAINPLVNGKGLGGPASVAVNAAGDVFIADTFNNRLVELQRSQPPVLSYPYPTNIGTNDIFDSTQTVQILNIGNQPLTVTSIIFPADFPQAGGHANECAGATTLSVGAECDLQVEFVPLSDGALAEDVTLTDNTLNAAGAAQSIAANGQGVVLATIISPTPGAPLPGANVTFSWTAGKGAGVYKLWLGNTGTGSFNLNNSGTTTATSVTVKGLPLDGETIYARLFTSFDGTLEYTDMIYFAAAPAAIALPVAGSSLTGVSVTFTWPPVDGAVAYSLILGSTGPGSYNLWNSGGTTAGSVTFSGLPVNGEKIYARLNTSFSGTWTHTDATFFAASLAPSTLTSPLPGSTLTGVNALFAWAPMQGATGYQILIGSTSVGSLNVYNSGIITATSISISGLPINGETLYVRLYTTFNGSSQYSDATCTAVTQTPATLASPKPGSTINSSAVFTWKAGQGVVGYQFMLGTTGTGSSDLYNSGPITAASATVSGLPANGATVYARLLSQIAGVWQSVDYAYTEAGTPAALTSPAAGSTLAGSSVTFTWTAGAGVTAHQLLLGATGAGSSGIYNSGSTKATSVAVTCLPANAAIVYARLLSQIGGVWQSTDYTYTEAGTPAALTSPKQGSTLSASNVTFTWTAGYGVTNYELMLGATGVGSNGLFDSGSTSAASVTAPSLQANAVTVYARLLSRIGGVWQAVDYTFTEASTAPVFTSPTPGNTLGAAGVTFAWTTGAGYADYQLWLGAGGPGSSSLFASGSTTATSVTVPNLPKNGAEIYARLYYGNGGPWDYTDYTFTGAGTPAALSSPTPGSTLGASDVTFTWTAGFGVTGYELMLGSAGVGSNELYDSGSTAATSVTVPKLPANAVTVYARLLSRMAGIWQSADYTFTEGSMPGRSLLPRRASPVGHPE